MTNERLVSSPRRAGGLSVWSGVGLVVANTIGAGVFVATGFMSQSMGPRRILLAWFLGGVMALLGARAYAALARLVPAGGGEYRLLRDLGHPLLGTIAGWMSVLVGFAAPVALESLAAVAFAATVVPACARAPRAMAAALVLLASVAHGFRLRTSVWVQNGLVVAKLALVVSFVAVGLWLGRGSLPPEVTPGPPVAFGRAAGWTAFVTNLFYVQFAYSGWNAGVYATDEFRDPQRDVWPALWRGCVVVAALYLALNWVFVANLGAGAAAVSARWETDRVTLAHAVAAALVGRRAAAAMSVLLVVTLASAVSAMTFAGPRVIAHMARDGVLPRALGAGPADGKPPWAAVAVHALLALALLRFSSLTALLDGVSVALTLSSGVTASLLLWPAVGARGVRARDRAAAAAYAAACAAMLTVAAVLTPRALAGAGVIAALGLIGHVVAVRARASAGAPPS